MPIQYHIEKVISPLLNISGLKGRGLTGAIWLGAGSGVSQGLRLMRNMILTRMIAPEAFGIMAIILAVNMALESFTEIGIKEAIVQNPKGEEESYLNGAWWISFIRSLGLYGIAFIASPWIAKFYSVPQLVDMLRLSLLCIIFNGVGSSRTHVALKKMNYSKWVVVNQGGGIFGILTTLVLVFFISGIWALMIGFLVESFSKMLLSFIIFPFVPRMKLKKEAMAELIKYAKGMFGLPILTFIFMQLDIFVVGKYFSKYDLGLYSMAVSLSQIPSFVISVFVNPLLMPYFSEIQYDANRINDMIIKSTSILVFLGFPALAFVASYSGELLQVAYGKQYGSMAIPLAFLTANTLIRACSSPIFNVYLAIGRPELHRLFTGIRAALIAIIIIPAVEILGLNGAALAGLVSMLIAYYFQVLQIHRLTGILVGRYFYILIKGLFISTLAIVCCFLSKYVISSSPLISLAMGISMCLVTYGVAFYVYNNKKNRAISSN